MPRFSLPKNAWQLVALVIAVIATLVARWNRETPRGSGRPEVSEKRTGGADSTPPKSGSSRKDKPRGKGWEVLTNCELVEDRTNDGDSFALRAGGETVTFRLYFADCPEKYRHQYNGDRIADQGAYFGGLSEEQTIATGVEAREFALSLLTRGPVTVETKWEEVYDSERYYAFVRVGDKDLAEALVSRGLARIHTKGTARRDGTPERTQKDRLYQLEREAKSQRRGGWGKR